MKNKILLLAFVFLFILKSTAQINHIRLDIRNFLINTDEVEILNDTTSTIVAPFRETTNNSFSYSLYYFRTSKKVNWYAGLGYNRGQNFSETTQEVNGNIRKDGSTRSNQGFQVHAGILKWFQIPKTKFNISAGTGISFLYTYQDNRNSYTTISDTTGSFLEGTEIKYDFTNHFSVGPKFELSAYYSFINNISIGFTHTTWFYGVFKKGENDFQLFQYGMDKEIIYEDRSIQAINSRILTKGHFFSASLLFNF